MYKEANVREYYLTQLVIIFLSVIGVICHTEGDSLSLTTFITFKQESIR